MRLWLLIGLLIGPLAILMSLAPIAQNPNYHAFADTRGLLGIPNCLNVVSNLPFLMVGLWGLAVCRATATGPMRHAWVMLFVGLALVAPGSAYYHWQPDNPSLFWDRLPMSVAFMSLFVALVGEFVDARIGRWLLWPAVLAGMGSVLYWQQTDDLRPYIWIQLLPLLIGPLVLVLFESAYTRTRLLLIALGWYVLAKVAELYDDAIYRNTAGIVSGHTLKHLLAATGAFTLCVMLRRRRPMEQG